MLILWSAVGSSPLTRGARHQSGHRHGLHGLIPAHAGSTSYRVRPAPVRPAHPRSRGEHAGVDFSHCLVAGSSPLTRGAPCPQASLCSVWGLIPAHAGSTKCLFISFTRSGAHPRSRGEHFSEWPVRAANSGSSPLTRGARGRSSLGCSAMGLIPAHAGSTPCVMVSSHLVRAHPRSRGEH